MHKLSFLTLWSIYISYNKYYPQKVVDSKYQNRELDTIKFFFPLQRAFPSKVYTKTNIFTTFPIYLQTPTISKKITTRISTNIPSSKIKNKNWKYKSKQENQNEKSTTPYSPGKEWLKKKVKTLQQMLRRRNKKNAISKKTLYQC